MYKYNTIIINKEKKKIKNKVYTIYFNLIHMHPIYQYF